MMDHDNGFDSSVESFGKLICSLAGKLSIPGANPTVADYCAESVES
jgi:hypothetical protein